MIHNMYAYHGSMNYFGRTHTVKSELFKPYEEDVFKAVEKFARRVNEHRFDVLHIDTTDRHYVICAAPTYGMEWFYFYGEQGSKSETSPCSLADIKKMVRKEFKESGDVAEYNWN